MPLPLLLALVLVPVVVLLITANGQLGFRFEFDRSGREQLRSAVWPTAIGAMVGAIAATGARARSKSVRILPPVYLASCAALVGALGVLARAYDGYAEDNGSTQMQTLHLAIPFLAEAALLYLLGWFEASRRSSRTLTILARAGGAVCLALVIIRSA